MIFFKYKTACKLIYIGSGSILLTGIINGQTIDNYLVWHFLSQVFVLCYNLRWKICYQVCFKKNRKKMLRINTSVSQSAQHENFKLQYWKICDDELIKHSKRKARTVLCPKKCITGPIAGFFMLRLIYHYQLVLSSKIQLLKHQIQFQIFMLLVKTHDNNNI